MKKIYNEFYEFLDKTLILNQKDYLNKVAMFCEKRNLTTDLFSDIDYKDLILN